MKRLLLTNGGFALLDDDDHFRLSVFGWYRWKNRKKRATYACRNVVLADGRAGREYLHRAVLGLGHGDSRQVDHQNFNGLDCRRQNLRVVTSALNNRNQPLRRDSVSGVKGVKLCRSGRWISRIKLNRRERSLGLYDTVLEAAFAYNHASELLHGSYGAKNRLASVPLPAALAAEIRRVVELRIKPLLNP